MNWYRAHCKHVLCKDWGSLWWERRGDSHQTPVRGHIGPEFQVITGDVASFCEVYTLLILTQKFQVFMYHSVSAKVLLQMLFRKQFIERPQHPFEVGTIINLVV